MNTNGMIYEGIIFPITENGVQKMYVTNAPFEEISKAFYVADNIEEFSDSIRVARYKINKYTPTVQVDFDKKNGVEY